jgi:two-component system phosphate regulon response regulator OmpR
MSANILIIEDNVPVRELMRESLEENGYIVFAASGGGEALRILRVKAVDTVILDLVLPDADGLALLTDIRKLSEAPVIVVSGKGSLIDKVVGLEMGADDYLGKPFEVTELLARVKANVRRFKKETGKMAPAARKPAIRFGSHVLDPNKFDAFDSRGKACRLTAMEFRLLEALVMAPNRVLSREQLLEKVRDEALNVNDRAIDIQIGRIRRKIGDKGKTKKIVTVRSVGYMLAGETETLQGGTP